MKNVFRTAVLSCTTAIALASAAQAAPILYVDDSNGNIARVDVATGDVSIIGNPGLGFTDIAFDPNGVLYGITFTGLYRIDRTTAAATFIGALGQSLNSLVFSAAGTLYSANSSLYTIDTSTGATTLVGSGGGYASSGDLAFVGGNLYLSSASGTSTTNDLYRLNALTGEGTVVGNTGVANLFGLATPDNANLLGVADNVVYSIDVNSGASTRVVDFFGLSQINGTAFVSEAGGAVPEPTSVALLFGGAGALLATRRRIRK